MSTYVLRGINPELWEKFRYEAVNAGIRPRDLFVKFIEAYVNGEITFERDTDEKDRTETSINQLSEDESR